MSGRLLGAGKPHAMVFDLICKLGLWDRLRVLFTGHVKVAVKMATHGWVGATKTDVHLFCGRQPAKPPSTIQKANHEAVL